MQVLLKVKHDCITHEQEPELVRNLAEAFAVDWRMADQDKVAALKAAKLSQTLWGNVLYGHASIDRAIIFFRQSNHELHVVSCPLIWRSPSDTTKHTWDCIKTALENNSPKLMNPVLIEDYSDSVTIGIAEGTYGRLAILKDRNELAKWTAIIAAIVGIVLIVFGATNVWDQTAIFVSGIISVAALVVIARQLIKWDIKS